MNLLETTVVKIGTSPLAWPARGTRHCEHSELRAAAAASTGTGGAKSTSRSLAEAAALLGFHPRTLLQYVRRWHLLPVGF